MKVVEIGTVPMHNAEVLAHVIQSEQQLKSDKRSVPIGLENFKRDLQSYCRLNTSPFFYATITPEGVTEVTTKLKAAPFKLLQSDILAILNHVPREVDELSYLLEIDGAVNPRFTTAEKEEIISIVKKALNVL